MDIIRQPLASNAAGIGRTFQLEDFHVTAFEQSAVDKFKETLFSYVLIKEASDPGKQLVDLKTFCGTVLPNIPKVECSNVVYLSVVDLHADSSEAMQVVVAKLHREYGIGVSADCLVLVCDKKTHAHICELKHEYGADLDWVISFIGDYHLLFNYQAVLMKVYYDAGLKSLAESAGYRDETLTSTFKRTHQFLLQVWEAMYRQVFKVFMRNKDADSLVSDFCWAQNPTCLNVVRK